MSSFDLYNSNFINPLSHIKKCRSIKNYYSKKKSYSSDNVNFQGSFSANKMHEKAKTIPNKYNTQNKKDKNQKDKIKNRLKSKYKKLSFFSVSNKKESLLIKNKKIIQLNSLFNNKYNKLNKKLTVVFDNRDKNNSIIYKKELYNNKKDINIYNKSEGKKKKNIFEIIYKNTYNKDFKMRNLNNFNIKKSSNYRKDKYIKNNKLVNDLKDNLENNRLKLENVLLNLNFKTSFLKFYNNSHLMLNNCYIKNKSYFKKSNILDNFTNNTKSNENIFTSYKNKNNFYLNYNNKENMKKNLFKIKLISNNKNDVERKKILMINGIIKTNHSKESKNFLYNKKPNNIKIQLDSKDKNNNKHFLNNKKTELKINNRLNEDMQEIKLKSSRLKEINIIHKKLNQKKTSMEVEEKIEMIKLDKYEILEIIGKGTYSTVKKAKNKINNEEYALKIYDKFDYNNSLKKNNIKNEIEILKLINHKNVIKFIEEINTINKTIIVLELFEGLTLKDYYKKEIKGKQNLIETLTILKIIFKQIFKAMNYLHQNYISHRDIKMENILINDKHEIKIIDFGFGLNNPDRKIQFLFCGTPKYISPEILIGKGYFGEKSDLWSLGILIYKIYCNKYPFKGKNERELFFMIRNGKYLIPENIPTIVRNIIIQLIIVDPLKRISCEDIINSPWLKE